MRKSFSVALLAAGVIAAVAAVFAFWLPSVHASQDRKWQAAGQRALAQVTLPAPFHLYNRVDARIQVCGQGPAVRCYVGGGDPQQNLASVQAAMASVANGQVHAVCQQVPIPNSPKTCVVQVPVAGSKLVVDMFARAVPNGKPVSEWTWNGTYAEVHLTDR